MQERMMVEKLNQTRASGISGNSHPRNNLSMSASSKKSPVKKMNEPVANGPATSQKKGNRNFFDQDDLNDRIEFDKSIKVQNAP